MFVRSNCWFCNTDSNVFLFKRNCWTCPNCDQYNGFNEDGDYNKDIVEMWKLPREQNGQYIRNLRQRQAHLYRSTNCLCEQCNIKQRIKIEKLSEFVPQSENTFEIEIEHYKEHLERIYALCPTCASRVRFEITKQDGILKQYLLKLGHFAYFFEFNSSSNQTSTKRAHAAAAGDGASSSASRTLLRVINGCIRAIVFLVIFFCSTVVLLFNKTHPTDVDNTRQEEPGSFQLIESTLQETRRVLFSDWNHQRNFSLLSDVSQNVTQNSSTDFQQQVDMDADLFAFFNASIPTQMMFIYVLCCYLAVSSDDIKANSRTYSALLFFCQIAAIASNYKQLFDHFFRTIFAHTTNSTNSSNSSNESTLPFTAQGSLSAQVSLSNMWLFMPLIQIICIVACIDTIVGILIDILGQSSSTPLKPKRTPSPTSRQHQRSENNAKSKLVKLNHMHDNQQAPSTKSVFDVNIRQHQQRGAAMSQLETQAHTFPIMKYLYPNMSYSSPSYNKTNDSSPFAANAKSTMTEQVNAKKLIKPAKFSPMPSMSTFGLGADLGIAHHSNTRSSRQRGRNSKRTSEILWSGNNDESGDSSDDSSSIVSGLTNLYLHRTRHHSTQEPQEKFAHAGSSASRNGSNHSSLLRDEEQSFYQTITRGATTSPRLNQKHTSHTPHTHLERANKKDSFMRRITKATVDVLEKSRVIFGYCAFISNAIIMLLFAYLWYSSLRQPLS